ncbi:MAG TPA: phenylalanine--tRNA ligase subunit beta [Acidimicrobiales bacterium]|jgi:phenylalanyl-tRNA synthetase beta chain|nr:phenylalanine--tRNA ligase subunit beta [Acidimicrobiales bacterium]
MRVPLSWLREFAPIDRPTDELAVALSNLGLVVDGIEIVGSGLDGVVVAQVLALRPHPDADRVQLVDVDPGDGGPLQIVCGAFNMAAGDLVPLATLGTVMPGGMEIGRRRMRGEWSNGMLCSAAELELPDVDGEKGIHVLAPGLAEPGTPLRTALGLQSDVVFDLDITPNRPDALSVAGVARDLAAALGVPFHLPDDSVPVDTSVAPAPVEVLAGDLCPRFTATVIEDVRVGPSPAWLAGRLTLAGMRPINNVVDVSNYVMLELGQPNHAYDLDRLAGRGLGVRRARAGETLVTLDEVERRLEPDDCLIVDGEDTPVGIAGIMGGASAEISDTTSTVVLEAAYFDPMAIARTGKRLGLHTEARSRFERGVDPAVIDRAVDRFAALLSSSSPVPIRRGRTADLVAPDFLPKPRDVRVRTGRVNDILGTCLTDGDIVRLLDPIGFQTRVVDDGILDVAIPTWRPDSTREIDVVEEIARLHGYRNIERTLPPGVRTGGGLTPYQRQRRLVRDILVGAEVSEAWTTTFLGPGDLERAGLPGDAVEVENPLDRSESLLRTSLLPGLLKAIRFNADRQSPDVRLFEIGHVFGRPPAGASTPVPLEREDLAIVMSGADADATLATRLWGVLAKGMRLSGVRLEPAIVAGMHPSRTARIVADGQSLGAVGEVDPAAVAAYGLTGRVGLVMAELEALVAAPRQPAQARPVSRFPASDFDLAFVVVDRVPAAAVRDTLLATGGELAESVTLFDVYRGAVLGDRRRSLAFRVRLRALDHTLTESEVASMRTAMIDAVTAAHGAELRG